MAKEDARKEKILAIPRAGGGTGKSAIARGVEADNGRLDANDSGGGILVQRAAMKVLENRSQGSPTAEV
jgi:hypothetical protein